jgi:hypothetical protein
MVADVEVRRLITFETATDGTAVRLVVEDKANRTVGVVFTVETLTALLITLPTMASSVIRHAHGDPNMRVTYPANEFRLALGRENIRTLTIGTSDGFVISFGLTEEFLRKLVDALLASGGETKKH